MSFQQLPTDLKLLIAEFIIEKPLKLLDWIDEKKVKETLLIKSNIEKLLNSFKNLSIRKIDVFISEEHDNYLEEKYRLSVMSKDPSCLDYFLNNQDIIDWFEFIDNPAIYELDKRLYRKLLSDYIKTI